MFNNAKAFARDISGWNFPPGANMNRMFYGAASFNQDLCEWGDRFNYVTSTDLFTGTGCVNKMDPTEALQGPFCASECLATTATTTAATAEPYCMMDSCTQEVWDAVHPALSWQDSMSQGLPFSWDVSEESCGETIENYPWGGAPYENRYRDVANSFPECRGCDPYEGTHCGCLTCTQDVWDAEFDWGGNQTTCGQKYESYGNNCWFGHIKECEACNC